MKVLGFRADQACPRYAIVESVAGTVVLCNASTETKLNFPVSLTEVSQKLDWLYREFERIFHTHSIDRVVIKSNEYAGTENAAKRLASYLEAMLILYCQQNSIPVALKLYSSLATRRADVKNHAEQRIGRTPQYWDQKMADAVVAAWWGMRQQ